jgi:hypothetical protein
VRKFAFHIMVLFGLLTSVNVAQAYTKGDWVLGNYQNSNYWFAGVVSDVGNGQYVIRYDDGELETLSASKVKSYDWAVGSKVECNFASKGKWYPGNITGLSGASISIAYDDGDKEHTKTSLCRSR